MTEDTSKNEEMTIEDYRTRADLLGVKYHPNIGVEKLRTKITEHMAQLDQESPVTEQTIAPVAEPAAPEFVLPTTEVETPAPVITERQQVPDPYADIADESVEAKPPVPVVKKLTKGQIAHQIKQEATKLVRVRITCMNPGKREWEGEIFQVSNRVTGVLKKYVPYGVDWHVPNMILNMIQERQCQVFTTVKGSRGFKSRVGKLIKEFGVEILPRLTEDDIKDLAQRQAMAKGTAE